MGKAVQVNIQIVPGKVLVTSNPQRINNLAEVGATLVKITFSEQIVAGNIIILTFNITECGKHPFQFQGFTHLLIPCKPDKTRFVFIFFLSAEKYIQSHVSREIRREYGSTELRRHGNQI